ncbi:hypothetical protein [Cellulomonas triticagri]|uniref:ABC transporter permease n=1 Tax=Cellulomonas triticagri TaxID=2483352 RepID=A0A3M2JP23_9CELL|nr:hypothetical protein [Cellulomonas triticagri]RMI14061.1 hypothetical protein EBM89_01685 [Cellulomonas triticagri]
MTAPTAPHRPNPGRAGPTRAALRAELTKALTLRSLWIGAGVILALNVYFAQMNVSLLADLAQTLEDGRFVAYDGTVASFETAVRDSILSSPYQSAALFVPLLIAVVCGQEYRTGQIRTTAAAVPNRWRLATVQIIVSVVLGVVVTILAFVMSDVVLLLALPAEGRDVVLSAAGMLVGAKVLTYSAVMSVVAGVLTTVLRSTMPALVAIVAVLVLALSGVLLPLSPLVHGLLPMIAAKTFLFGYAPDATDPSVAAGLVILLGWLTAGAATWFGALRYREIG